jgi:hypothetical protein
MGIQSKWPLTTAALAASVAFASQCGGTTKPNDSDAATDGSSGSSGASGSGSGSGSSGSSSGNDGSSSGGQCKCMQGFSCCGGQCIYTLNDPLNCGGCGIQCTGNTPFCNGSGQCEAPPCTMDGSACASPATCCGAKCCDSTQICCEPDGPLDKGPECQTPTGNPPTCAPGCAPQCASDRNIKRDIEPVDEQAVLEAVAHMPVSTWSYKSDDPAVRHMGPMAQDFRAAFQLGNTDKAYNSIDAHGVALAAIQALYERVQAQDARIERLEHDNDRLRATCP